MESQVLELRSYLVHDWDRIKHVHLYSLSGLSAHKNVKCYPTVTKVYASRGAARQNPSKPSGPQGVQSSGLLQHART